MRIPQAVGSAQSAAQPRVGARRLKQAFSSFPADRSLECFPSFSGAMRLIAGVFSFTSAPTGGISSGSAETASRRLVSPPAARLAYLRVALLRRACMVPLPLKRAGQRSARVGATLHASRRAFQANRR